MLPKWRLKGDKRALAVDSNLLAVVEMINEIFLTEGNEMAFSNTKKEGNEKVQLGAMWLKDNKSGEGHHLSGNLADGTKIFGYINDKPADKAKNKPYVVFFERT